MTRSARRRELTARLAGAQKSNRGAAGYSRWVNRPLGRRLAVLAYLGGLTPNQVSVLSAACTFPAIVLIAAVDPSWPIAVVIVGLLVIGYALDSADGQVARLRGGGSAAGEWLDHVLDALKTSAIHLAVVVAWFRFYDLDHPALLLIPLTFNVVGAVFFFAIVLSDMLRRIARVAGGRSGVTTASLEPSERAPVLRSLVVLPNDYGVLCLAMALLPLHRTFMTGYTALLVANVVFLIVGCARWFAEMGRL